MDIIFSRMKAWQAKKGSYRREVLFNESLPMTIALEMRIHLIKSPKSNRHHVKPYVMTTW
jgi:hypothetical protein